MDKLASWWSRDELSLDSVFAELDVVDHAPPPGDEGFDGGARLGVIAHFEQRLLVVEVEEHPVAAASVVLQLLHTLVRQLPTLKRKICQEK